MKIQVTNRCSDLTVPTQASLHAAGLDLRAAIDDDVILQPGERRLVPSGLSIAIPPGFEGQVRPRSGLALKHGVTLLNSPGTIDADYRGEIGAIMINHGTEPFVIRRGDRIAQLVIAAVAHAELEAVEALPDTERGAGGFGSSGRT